MSTSVLKGLAASPGKYDGRAFLSERPTDLPVGDIEVLVIHAAGVDWLEAILRSKAVVTEVGGKTSHAATICREFGKPCVTAVAGLMSKLRNGVHISVDGYSGEITIFGKDELN